MSSALPSSPSSLPTYSSLTTSRLKSLYSDFTYQKHSNPTSYVLNIEWWRDTLEAALVQGCLSDNQALGVMPDRLILHAHGVTFTDRFRVEGVGKPLSIPTVIFELCSSKTFIPFSEFLGATRSIYDPGWLPYRIASFVVGKPLWWALGQLGILDSHGAAFGDSGTAERWKKVRGDYVVVSLLEGAGERILERQREKSTGQLADSLYNMESFRAEFASCAFRDAPLSPLDIKVVLKYLERDKSVVIVRGETIKFVDEGTAQLSEITAVDCGLLALTTSIDKLQAHVDSVQQRIDERTREISAALKQKRKELAMMHLRARKQLEDVLMKRLSSLELLNSTLHRVETSAGDIEIMRSYESSAATLREILAHPLLQREKIDETMDALEAANADAREVATQIQIGVDMAQAEAGIGDSELEAELQALVDEVETEKARVLRSAELRTPAHTPQLETPTKEALGSTEQQMVPVGLQKDPM